MSRSKTLLRAAALPTLVAAVTWTSAGFVSPTAGASTKQLSKQTVQTQVAKTIAAQSVEKPPKVTCPSGVKAKIGAVVHCIIVPAGSKLQYPGTVTVESVKGKTPAFKIQLSQALGQANMAKFCADNATINKALFAATTPSQFLQALDTNRKTILDFQNTAPDPIFHTASTIALTAGQAIKSVNPSAFASKSVQDDIVAVDKFCGQPVP